MLLLVTHRIFILVRFFFGDAVACVFLEMFFYVSSRRLQFLVRFIRMGACYTFHRDFSDLAQTSRVEKYVGSKSSFPEIGSEAMIG